MIFTKAQMAEVLHALQKKEDFLREAGQQEYAHNDVEAFANFNRVATQLGVDRKVVLYTYLFKHLDGIVSHIKGHHSQRENVIGRILDARVYLALLAGMILEESAVEGGNSQEILDFLGFHSFPRGE
jgi:hypothetical protein